MNKPATVSRYQKRLQMAGILMVVRNVFCCDWSFRSIFAILGGCVVELPPYNKEPAGQLLSI